MMAIFCLVTSLNEEARGFEPPILFDQYNAFRVRPIQPLWHASMITYNNIQKQTSSAPSRSQNWDVQAV